MADDKNSLFSRFFINIILGTIAFGLLFNLFFGGETMDHMSGMGGLGMSTGASLDTFLGGLILFLVKVLLLVLTVAVIIAIVMWVKNTFFRNYSFNSKPFNQLIKNDPILKTITYVSLAFLGLALVIGLFGGFANSGMGYGMNNGMMGYPAFNTTLSIAGILQLLIKLLTFILVIALIMALAAYIKKLYDQGAFKMNRPDSPSGINQQPHEQGNNSGSPE